MTTMTADQRSALRDPAAFGLRKLKRIQRMCGDGRSINDIWLEVNFAVYDLKLGNARRKRIKPRTVKRKSHVQPRTGV